MRRDRLGLRYNTVNPLLTPQRAYLFQAHLGMGGGGGGGLKRNGMLI